MFANEGGISPGGVPIRHNDVAGRADLLGEAIAFWHRGQLSEARTAYQSRPNRDQQCDGYYGDVTISALIRPCPNGCDQHTVNMTIAAACTLSKINAGRGILP